MITLINVFFFSLHSFLNLRINLLEREAMSLPTS